MGETEIEEKEKGAEAQRLKRSCQEAKESTSETEGSATETEDESQEGQIVGKAVEAEQLEQLGLYPLRKKPRISETDYEETSLFMIRGLDEAMLKAAGLQDTANLAKSSAEIRELLEKCG